MIKMIKQIEDEIYYWEVWKDGRKLIIHYGTVGDTGEIVEQKLSLFQKAEKVMEELAKEKAFEGFVHVNEDELIELLIQFRYYDGEMESALEKRYFIQDLADECLNWTGNGYCDGGEIEISNDSGIANIFNYVIDVETAAQTLIQELENNNLLGEVKLAYYSTDSEKYITIYPEGDEIE